MCFRLFLWRNKKITFVYNFVAPLIIDNCFCYSSKVVSIPDGFNNLKILDRVHLLLISSNNSSNRYAVGLSSFLLFPIFLHLFIYIFIYVFIYLRVCVYRLIQLFTYSFLVLEWIHIFYCGNFWVKFYFIWFQIVM